MLRSYLADIDLPDSAAVLDVGCGTGAVSRELAARFPRGRVVGIDPSPVFLAAARALAVDFPSLSFVEGDCRSLPHDEACFDAVFFHTTLSHVPGAESALNEAFRVLHPGGILAVFDGNYTTTTLATGDFDPLQAEIVQQRFQKLLRLVMQAGRAIQQIHADDPQRLLLQ